MSLYWSTDFHGRKIGKFRASADDEIAWRERFAWSQAAARLRVRRVLGPVPTNRRSSASFGKLTAPGRRRSGRVA